MYPGLIYWTDNDRLPETRLEPRKQAPVARFTQATFSDNLGLSDYLLLTRMKMPLCNIRSDNMHLLHPHLLSWTRPRLPVGAAALVAGFSEYLPILVQLMA
jgi:hypothetical protein